MHDASSTVTLLADLRRLRHDLAAIERRERHTLASISPAYSLSARNLLHVIAFHAANHPGLATALRERGLSSLEDCDAHLAASLHCCCPPAAPSPPI